MPGVPARGTSQPTGRDQGDSSPRSIRSKKSAPYPEAVVVKVCGQVDLLDLVSLGGQSSIQEPGV